MTQVQLQPQYVPDTVRSRAVFNGKLYFGVVDTDPRVSGNQKLVKGVLENGSEVNLPQPVSTNSGGVPTYNGSPVILSVDGDFSYAADRADDTQVYYFPRVTNPEDGSQGFSGVVATEDITLTAGQTVINLTNLGANESVLYYYPATAGVGDQGWLYAPGDYTVTGPQQVTLTSSRNVGDIIQFRQNDPTGQLVPVNEDSEPLLVFPDVASAQTAAANGNVVLNDTVTLNGNASTGDGLGGDKYSVITTAFANDGVNYIDLNGALQLELQSNYYRFQNYCETIGSPSIAAGTLTIDLDEGVTQDVTLTENIGSITFANFNPSSSLASTVYVRIRQDGVGSRGVAWPASILWPGGAAPTVTATANAIDEYTFTTFDAGVTWSGKIIGQDFS